MQLTDYDTEQAIEELGLGGKVRDFRRVYYEYIINFDTLTAGANQAKSSQINQGGSFVVQAIKGSVWIPTAGTADAYTPLYYGAPGYTEANLTWESLMATRLDIRTIDTNWFSNPIRGGLILGDSMNPYYLPTTRPIARNDELIMTLYNDSTQSVQGQVALAGHKLIRR